MSPADASMTDRLKARLRTQPVTRTRPGHAKLAVALGLALDACDELAGDVAGHDCRPEGEVDGACRPCVLAGHAAHMPYTLGQYLAALKSDCCESSRLEFLAGRLGEVLGQWLDDDRRRTP